MKDLFKKKKEQGDDLDEAQETQPKAKSSLFAKKEKSDKGSKTGGLFAGGFGKKAEKAIDKVADEVGDFADEVADTAHDVVDTAKQKIGFGKGKKTTKPTNGKGGLDFDINKLDTKKIITGLVALLVVLVLLLVASMFMGGDEKPNSDVPQLQPAISEPKPAPEPVAEPAPQPEPVQEPVAPPPVAAPPAPMPEPVTPPPAMVEVAPPPQAAAPTPNPALTEVPKDPVLRIEQPSTAQPTVQPRPQSGGTMTQEDFINETKHRVFREHNTAPPTATK